MASLRKIDPLVLDEEVADNFIQFEREWKVYQAAALSEKKTKKIQSYILLNRTGAEAILTAESFQYTTHESREDSEVLLTKFREKCMPTKILLLPGIGLTQQIRKQPELSHPMLLHCEH